MSVPEPRLEQVQRWMQAVIVHRGGVAEAVDSPEARAHLEIGLAELEQVIERSRSLSAANRLEIYVNAYYARLMECLDEEFAVTRYALGDELFGAVAFGYLQFHPSQSYTLGRLGERFPRYLAESRLHAAAAPAGASASWPDFVVELAAFERLLSEVYDGPGSEHAGGISTAEVAAVAAERWHEIRLLPAPCLRLARFEHPVNAYWAERKDGGTPSAPQQRPLFLAVHRRDYVVERRELAGAEYAVLARLVAGATLGSAIAAALDDAEETLPEARLSDWFARWSADGYFAGVAG